MARSRVTGFKARAAAVARTAPLVVGAILVALVLAELLLWAFVPLRNVGPSFSVHDSRLGRRLKANFATVRYTPEFTMHFSTNSLGFRGPEPTRPPRGGILFLGDSFTMGYGVDDSEPFPALIAAKLAARADGRTPVPVINAGMGGTGSDWWLPFLERDAPRFTPHLVVLQAMVNDFEDNWSGGLFRLGRDDALVYSPVAKSIARMALDLVTAVPGLDSLHLTGLLRQVATTVKKMLRPYPGSAADPLTFRLIEAAVQRCRDQGYSAAMVSFEITGARLNRLRQIAAQFDLPLLVMPSKSERPDLYYRVDGHLTAHGHVVVAERMLAELERLDLLPQP